jgi:flagellar hook-length control protein FliK
MKASLPILSLASDSPASLSGQETEFAGIQGDRSNSAGFPALLEEAHSATYAEFATAPPGVVETLNLPDQLHILPQAGNLLPLLEQLVEAAVANGAEPRQALLQVAEQLNQQGALSEANPGAALVGVLQQMLDESPAPTVSAARDALALMSGDGKMPNTAALADSLRGRSPLELLQPQTEAQEGTKVPSLERTVEQFQLRQPEQRQTELAGLMATLKRLTPRPQVASSDTTPLRAEPLTAAVSAPTSQAPGVATSSLPTVSVSTPLAQGDWDQALGERIQWMVNRKVQGAQIRLNPSQLGPMEVRIHVHNDQASIQFSSAHSVVREALEAALPRLRELLDSSGVELVDVDVSGQSSSGGQRARDDQDVGLARGTPLLDAAAGPETVLETPIDYVPANGRLDLFA